MQRRLSIACLLGCACFLAGLASDPVNTFIKVRAQQYEVWDRTRGGLVMDIESEITQLKKLEQRVATLESDLAALSRSRSPATPIDPSHVLPSDAVRDFQRTWTTFNQSWKQIETLRSHPPMDPRDDRDRPQRQELANSLTLEQNKRWAHLLEVARDLPASHAQWRFVIE